MLWLANVTPESLQRASKVQMPRIIFEEIGYAVARANLGMLNLFDKFALIYLNQFYELTQLGLRLTKANLRRSLSSPL